MTSVTIYGLIDPRSGRCRYVGKTKGDESKRLRAHICDAMRRGGEIPRFRWINQLLALGLTPQSVTLERVHEEDWRAAERMWIAEMRHRFHDLLNATDGGDGVHGYVHKKETRATQSAKAIARYQRLGEREKTGDSVRNALAKPDSHERLKLTAKVRSSDPKLRSKLSEKAREFASRPEVRAARSAALKGRVITPEWREKISIANKGRKPTAETRAKMSAARVGRRHSPETICKMRATAARRKASNV